MFHKTSNCGILVFTLVEIFLLNYASGQCTYATLTSLNIPSRFISDMTSGSALNSSQTVIVECANSSLVTDLGPFITLTCVNTSFTGVPTTWPSCRIPLNCTTLPPTPPLSTGLSPTNSTVLLEGDEAAYYCTNPWYIISGGDQSFSLYCGLNGTFSTNVTWPTCFSPIPPLPPCQCIGDASVATIRSQLVNGLCHNSSLVDYPPSKRRCGTRSLTNLTLDNFCFCDSLATASNTSYYAVIRLLSMPWEWTWDPKTNISYLLNSSSDFYTDMQLQIENALDHDAMNNANVSSGFVQFRVVNFTQGVAVPKGIFPNVKPPTTTTTTISTTTTSNTTTGTGATTTKASTLAGRRKRQATQPSYTYINVLVNAQFLKSGIPTLQNFTSYLQTLGLTTGGSLTSNVKLDLTCPPTICGVRNTYTCTNDYLDILSKQYDVVTKYGPYVSNSINLTEPGDLVELSCTQSLGPQKYPLSSSYDPQDQTLVTYCAYPMSGGNATFALSKYPIPPCTPICTGWFPTADVASDLLLVNISSVANPNQMNPISDFTYDPNFFLFAGDSLVYECITNFTAVYAGSNRTTMAYGCTSTGLYNTPPTGKWPSCLPEQRIVVSGVALMLNNYDTSLSDRFKLIAYQDSDNLNKVVVPMNYFTNVTIPTMLGLIFVIFMCCICSSKGSLICKICESKA